MFAKRIGFALVLAAGTFVPFTLGPGGQNGGLPAMAQGGMGMNMSAKEHVGMMLYKDANLSRPAGQSCASCHHPMAGFADPDWSLPVSEGAVAGRFGGRNSPTAAYQATAPDFHIEAGEAVGGQFWDGRAANLVEQAKGPFLNPVEMNNRTPKEVVDKVARSMYATMFRSVYGSNVFKNPDLAFQCIADAIAAYEKSMMLNGFTSKYDLSLRGEATLTAQEAAGLAEFKEHCSACHPAEHAVGGMAGMAGVFTDFKYRNIGLPKNLEYPLSNAPVDPGLKATTGNDAHAGLMKTPTLRNIAVTAPYGHNGLLKTLEEVVHFKNVRWGTPEVNHNIALEVGGMGMTSAEEAAIVAFLKTLTDSSMGMGGGGGGGGGMGSGGGGMGGGGGGMGGGGMGGR